MMWREREGGVEEDSGKEGGRRVFCMMWREREGGGRR